MIKVQKLDEAERVISEESLSLRGIKQRMLKGKDRLIKMESEPNYELILTTLTVNLVYKGRNKIRLSGDIFKLFPLCESVARTLKMSRLDYVERVSYRGKIKQIKEVNIWTK